MKPLRLSAGLAGLLLLCASALAQTRDALVMIAHPSVPHVDVATAQRLYSGRAIEVQGQPVTPANAAAPSRARERFLALVMNMDDDKYVAHWTVRRHVGKGTPPREFRSAAEMIDFVQSTPGAIGYVLEADLKPGLNIVLRP